MTDWLNTLSAGELLALYYGVSAVTLSAVIAAAFGLCWIEDLASKWRERRRRKREFWKPFVEDPASWGEDWR